MLTGQPPSIEAVVIVARRAVTQAQRRTVRSTFVHQAIENLLRGRR